MNNRRLKAGALLAAGALIASPALAATFTQVDDAAASHRLIEAARAIAEQQLNETTWEGDSTWRIDPATGHREVRMTFPREAAVLPFNLFDHFGYLGAADQATGQGSGRDGLIEGAGERRIIVPGDAGATTIRVHNDGPTAGVLTARFSDNLLHNLAERTHQWGVGLDDYGIDPAYEYLFVNGVPVADFFADPSVVISFAGVSQIPIDAGSYVDLPFDWSFFAYDGDAFYRERHNIGNEPYTRADFQLHLDISGQITQLTVLKAIEGPDLDAAFVELGGDWDMGVFAVGHVHDDALHAASPEFSGLYQTAAMRGASAGVAWANYGSINASPTTGLLVSPEALYTAVLLNSASADFLLDQRAKDFDEIAASFVGGKLADSLITPLERDVFGEAIGSLQCVLLSPFSDAMGTRTIVDNGTGAWARGIYGGRNGLVQVPADHHAVCEKVSRTSVVNVQKVVHTYDAEGVLVAGGALPAEWEINITPVGGTAELNFTQNALVTAPAAIGPTQAISADARVLPAQAYRVDMIAPPGRIIDGYSLVDVFLTPRGTWHSGVDARNVPVVGFRPFGVTLADSPTRVEPAEGVTASWVLHFDELTASTITFVSSNHAAVTEPPIQVPGQVIPGQVIPGQVIPGAVIPGAAVPGAGLTPTGADIALGLLAVAVVAVGAGLAIAGRRRGRLGGLGVVSGHDGEASETGITTVSQQVEG